MNTRTPEPEKQSGIVQQKQTYRHPFEWPDDQQDAAPPIDSNLPWAGGEHFSNWSAFWFITWLGTTIAGSLFGGALGMFGAMQDPMVPFAGLFLGGLWAGAVGLFVHVHLVAICWAFWWLGRPLRIAIIAGALTGAICGLAFLSIFTGPMGAFGAYLAGNKYLKSSNGKSFLATIKKNQDQSLGPMRFTMMDLFLRVTVFAVFLAGWTAWLQSF